MNYYLDMCYLGCLLQTMTDPTQLYEQESTERKNWMYGWIRVGGGKVNRVHVCRSKVNFDGMSISI